MVLNNHSRHFLGCLLASAALCSPAVPAFANDLNAAQKAVRMEQFGQALTLFHEAAESGNPEAQYQLGNMYQQGRGTPKNESTAAQWFELAAEKAHPGAQYGLAQLLLKKEPQRARSLLTAAADQGYRAAKIQLERLTPAAFASQESPLEAQWFGAARKNDVSLLKILFAEHNTIDTTDEAGRTALFYAVKANSTDAAQWLIKQDSNINHRDKFGLTPLQTAVEQKDSKLLQTLIEAGAEKNQVLSNGDNLILYALRRRHYAQVAQLIKHGVNVNQKNKDGLTPLDLAEHQGAEATAALLRKRGAVNGSSWRDERKPQNLNAVIEQLNQGVLPPLARAIVNDNQALVERLLKDTPELVNTPLEDGTTPLILAIKHNKPKIVSALLSHNAQVNQVAYRGVNAVQVAAQLGDLDALKTLLDAGGVPVHSDDQGRDALMSAIELKQTAAALLLLEHIVGDKRSRATADEQYAPIDHYVLLATKHYDKQILDALLPHVSSTPATDEQGRNALWFAASEGNSEVIPKLLKAGIPADTTDQKGRTPLLMAANSSCIECAKQLIPVSNINHQSKSGNTALMMAAANKDAPMVAWLIRNKADVEIRSQRGDTAVMLAVMSGSMETVTPLLKAEASVTRKNRLGRSSIDLAREVSPAMHELVRSHSVLGIF